MAQFGGELTRLCARLATRVTTTPVPTGSDDATERFLTFDAATHLLRRIASLRPLVLIVDDLQWAESMLLELEGERWLSEWGRVLWERGREALYGQELLPAPTPLIAYGPKFADSVRSLNADRMRHINEKIDLLMRHLESGTSDEGAPKSLSFKRLAGNPIPPSDHEFYAWSDAGAWRVYCHYEEGGGPLILDRLGEHLR